MKKIILKVPTFVFLLLFFAPILWWYLSLETEEALKYLALARIIPLVVGTIWSVSLLDYMNSESESNKYVRLTYIFLSLGVICQSVVICLIMMQGDSILINSLELVSLVNIIVVSIFLTITVKKVLYARTTWFVFLEVSIVPIGMLTLTPDVKKWEKSDKK